LKGGVTKPGKSRKRRFNAPHHLRRKHMAAPLSPALRAQHGVRSMPLRRDDNVMITKGDRRMTEGRVIRVDVTRGMLFVEGVTRQKLDGTTVHMPIRPENTMITRLHLDDERRRKALERRGYGSNRGRG